MAAAAAAAGGGAAALDTAEEGTVDYRPPQNAENVEIKSPAKNRYKGTPLTPSNPNRTRSNSKVPVLFERATSVLYNPRFESSSLEQQHFRNYFHMTKRRFQYALLYIIIACVAWILFFGLMQQELWKQFLAGSLVLLVINVLVLVFSFTQVYQRAYLVTSIFVSLVLCGFLLLSFVHVETEVSAVGTFVGTIEVVVLMYTVIPLPLYLSISIGVLHSVVFEVISAVIGSMDEVHYIVGRALMHVCIHLIGIHIFLLTQARRRRTFLKVGESLVSRQTLDHEKTVKRQMIYSLMPAQVAEEVMKSKEETDAEEERPGGPGPSAGPGGGGPPGGGKLKFRSFHMSQMENVSILFADIVGFTKMSSNKTAEHLVSLLNDLFGRFDILCDASGCEKISTLGDCYYCVSGCPEPRQDHAKCAIEMGIGMVKAIVEFDEDHNEAVNMRVGVHTGTVLCGLVGTRRFKFDVWSNDVNLANTMESEGMPGRVHISESTYKFVKEDYEVEAGKEVEDIRNIKVLIEDYNTETQQYQIRHVQEKDTIKTFFVVKRIGKSVGLVTPKAPRAGQKMVAPPPTAAPTQDGAAPASPPPNTNPDAVKVNVEDAEKKESDVNGSVSLQVTKVSGTEESSFIADDGRDESQNDTALLNQLVTGGTMDAKDADNRMVNCFQNSEFLEEYLVPPINKCTLNFLDSAAETDFRDHYMEDKLEGQTTFASPRVNAFLDMVVSFVFLILVSVCCFLGFPISAPWIVVFVIAFLLETFMLVLLLVDVCCGAGGKASLGRLSVVFSSWTPRHVIGAILACLPVIGAYSNFSCELFDSQPGSDLFYCVLVVVCLLHFCNFTMLNSYMKSTLATVAGTILLILLGVGVCKDHAASLSNNATVTYAPPGGPSNGLDVTEKPLSNAADAIFHGEHQLRFEIILNMALLLLLVWFLNREFEVSYRLSYHGNMQAAVDARKIQTEKEQADWLLHNIIPEHVSEVLKKTSKYCKNHQDVGVIFAKVVNFDEFYDESFEGGREYLRVLNELIGDMEDLFDDPRFKDVEKIKTIGSCLMAASGLNPATRNQNKDPKAHLYALLDFSVELLKKLDQFNLEIFNFDFEMSIGFNFGPITSGVIGSTKLLYDIWGDTVNVSSRMYSTGMSGRIQVTGDVAQAMEDMFDFEYRGEVFVKGKGDLKTYLMVKKKDGAKWE